MNNIINEATTAIHELIEKANVKKGQIIVIGCSSSEICGDKIGSNSSVDTANAVFNAVYKVANEKGIYIAAQCCEHLNRAIIVEKAAVPTADIVNVVPQPKAGGSFATAAYAAFEHPVAVEEIRADAGLDIGGTLIGMHLRDVAVPVRLSVEKIGEARIICARTRPKYIGGPRAQYE